MKPIVKKSAVKKPTAKKTSQLKVSSKTSAKNTAKKIGLKPRKAVKLKSLGSQETKKNKLTSNLSRGGVRKAKLGVGLAKNNKVKKTGGKKSQDKGTRKIKVKQVATPSKTTKSSSKQKSQMKGSKSLLAKKQLKMDVTKKAKPLLTLPTKELATKKLSNKNLPYLSKKTIQKKGIPLSQIIHSSLEKQKTKETDLGKIYQSLHNKTVQQHQNIRNLEHRFNHFNTPISSKKGGVQMNRVPRTMHHSRGK